MANSCLQTPTQYSLDIVLPKFATFETFVDTSGGQLLYDLQRFAGQNIEIATEPSQFYLWGATQTGKTHLLQAICNQLVNRQQSAIYLPMRELVNQQVSVLNNMHIYDVLCIDDIEVVLGNEEWERQLLLLINELRANNKSIFITSSNNPNDVNVSFPDLASRLVWGLVYKLNILDDDGKAMAIQAHAKARGIKLSSDVCSFLLKRFPRELKKLIVLLDELDKQSLALKRKVTVPFVKTVLNIN